MTKGPLFQPSAPRTVEIVGFPDVQLLDVAGPLQVFASANDLAAAAGEPRPYAPRIVSAAAPPVVCSAGVALLADALPRVGGALDTLLAPGGSGVDAAAADPALIDWLRARAATARRVASVCTGAFLLASAGLLDGRRAATHWSRCDELARRFPSVRVEADPIFVRDGAVWSSAGVTAGIDLALAFVEEDLGQATALAVARDLIVFLKRPGGQAQFSAALKLQRAEDRFGALHSWIRGNLDADLSLAALADRSGMSERSFSRRYAEEAGITPARAVEGLRVEAARVLITDSQCSLKEIALRCGFRSEEVMRRSFFRLFTTSPRDNRARFGGAGGAAPRGQATAVASR